MTIIVILWTLSTVDLENHRYVFPGTIYECQVKANLIKLESKGKTHAGCYETTKTLPYIGPWEE